MMHGTLRDGEPHPSAAGAVIFIREWIMREGITGLAILQESLASTALSGNRLSEILLETLNRFTAGSGISDRYALGLAWFLRDWDDGREQKREK